MKYFKISAVLCLISLVCAALIAGFNMLTDPIIKANAAKAELEACQAIFADYDQDKSEQFDISGLDSRITKKVLAKNASGEELGYLYTVSGKNSYGVMTLIVAIQNEAVYQVEVLENGQSFADIIMSHIKAKYPSSKDNKVVIDPYNKPVDNPAVGSLDSNALANIDTKCGATYGAILVKQLVTVALDDAKGVK